MNVIETEISGVYTLEPSVFGDDRGYFLESYNKLKFPKEYELVEFVQDNESKSSYGVLRGLHYQLPPFAQSKLVRVIKGSVIDVAVDIRKGSSTFGHHVAVELTEQNKKQLFVPRGFAHGFVVTSEEAIFAYKCDNYYSPEHDRGIMFNDPALNIDWKISSDKLILSEKDKKQPLLENAIDLFDINMELYV